MTDTSDAPVRKQASLLTMLVVAWSPFALGIAIVVFAAIVADYGPYARAVDSVILSFVLASPALWLFARDIFRYPLTPLWRLYWTLSFAAYLVHLYYGYGVLFAGDWKAVTASQGTTVAILNLAVTVLWAADVLIAWVGMSGTWVLVLRVAAHLGVFAAGIVSSVAFRDGIEKLPGILLALGLAYGIFDRLRSPRPILPENA
jgi:hypothetical protein